jgi:adenylate kinase family enzyme
MLEAFCGKLLGLVHVNASNAAPSIVGTCMTDFAMSQGWIMDGWPRTGEHARNMRAVGLDPQIMVKLEVPDSVIEDRVSFRSVCRVFLR